MAYSEIGFVTKSGGRVEGDRVAPDIEVNVTRDDYLLNRDRVMERAVAFLSETTKPASKP